MSRLKHETWKMHPKFTDYEISDWGRVRRRINGPNAKAGKVLKPYFNINGYLYVVPYKENKRKSKFIHRLVLETFVGPCPENHQCNHKDGIKTNNFVSNLEWVTSKENTIHSWKNGLQTARKGKECNFSKLKEGEIWMIRKLLSEKVSQTKISKIFKVHQSTISLIKHKKTWKYLKS